MTWPGASIRLAVICACCRSMQAGVGLDQLIRTALQTGGAVPKQRSRAGSFTMKFGMVVMAAGEEAGSAVAAGCPCQSDVFVSQLLLACLCQLCVTRAGKSMASCLSDRHPACLQACSTLHCQNSGSRQQGATQHLPAILWVSWALLSVCRPLSGPVTFSLSSVCSSWQCADPGPADVCDWLVLLPGWEGRCRMVPLWWAACMHLTCFPEQSMRSSVGQEHDLS